MSETVISAKGEGVKESEARRGTLKRYRSLLQFVPCMSLRPGCPDHGTLRFPSGSWRGLEGGPLFGSRLHLHRSSFPSLIEPTIFFFPHLARMPCGDSISHLNRHERSEALVPRMLK